MAKTIVCFNHKGGVSKTTTTFNIGWKLAEMGKTVLMADMDSQCNLTGMVCNFENLDGDQIYSKIYDADSFNIKSGLSPAFESKPEMLQPGECIQIPKNDKLLLLPGNINLGEYDISLGVAHTSPESFSALQNLPGSIIKLLKITADKYNADYVLIDTSPSLSQFNKNLFVTSDYFIIPASPDLYSLMAMESLAKILPDWFNWAKKTSSLETLKHASYPFPPPHTKFLGIVMQNYSLRDGRPTKYFQKWIDKISHVTKNNLVKNLEGYGIMMPHEKYAELGIEDDYVLSKIPNFSALMAASQINHKPVFALTEQELEYKGNVKEKSMIRIKEFNETFSTFAEKILALTQDE